MELFYSCNVSGGTAVLEEDEFRHCCKVLRKRTGDTVNVIDGSGSLYVCRLEDVSSSKAFLRVTEEIKDFGSHPYRLVAAVAPTKNMDRYEWFLEKSAEMGLDECVPVVCRYSERKVVKTERLEKVALSAAKQSLKGQVTRIAGPVAFADFMKNGPLPSGRGFVCYCGEEYPKVQFADVLMGLSDSEIDEGITVLIGPEGDFDPSEVKAAVDAGFVPIALGNSRLRTETAAVFAVAAVYFRASLAGTIL